MFHKRTLVLPGVLLALITTLAVLFLVPALPVLAGNCTVTLTMNPVTPYTLGTNVQLHVTSNCGTVKFTIGGADHAEIGGSEQWETWKTAETGTGNIEVCALGRSDGGWENGGRDCRTVYVEGSQAPPPGSQPGQNVRCWVNNFTATPSSGPVGTTFQLAGQGQCDGNARAARFSIDGGPFGEAGQNTISAGFQATEGTHSVCFVITAGDWSQAAQSCTSITVNSGGATSNDVSVGQPADNGQAGQTGQSNPDGSYTPATSPVDTNSPAVTGSSGAVVTGGNATTNSPYYQPVPPALMVSNQMNRGTLTPPTSGDYVQVTEGAVHLRAGPSTSNNVIGYVQQWDYYQLYQISGDWGLIAGDHGSGWIKLQFAVMYAGNPVPQSSPVVTPEQQSDVVLVPLTLFDGTSFTFQYQESRHWILNGSQFVISELEKVMSRTAGKNGTDMTTIVFLYSLPVIGEADKNKDIIVNHFCNHDHDCEFNLQYVIGSRTMDVSGLGNIVYGFYVDSLDLPLHMSDLIAGWDQLLSSLRAKEYITLHDNSDDVIQRQVGHELYRRGISIDNLNEVADELGIY